MSAPRFPTTAALGLAGLAWAVRTIADECRNGEEADADWLTDIADRLVELALVDRQVRVEIDLLRAELATECLVVPGSVSGAELQLIREASPHRRVVQLSAGAQLANCGLGHDVTRISCEDAAAVRAEQRRAVDPG